MDTSDIEDGGPAFPVSEESARGKVAGIYGGMSKRELYAVILMHGELVTNGVPGEAADALVVASRRAGDDVIDHMAGNAVEAADALLRALAAPKPAPEPAFPTFNVYAASATRRTAIKRIAERADFEELPSELRQYIAAAVSEIARVDADEDEIPF